MKKIVVAGGGVLGSQIAFQAAFCGFDVTIWLRSEASIGRTKPKLEAAKNAYIARINKMATDEGKSLAVWARGIADVSEAENFNKDEYLKKVENAANGLKIELDLQKAVSGADLIIESMSEDFKQKEAFYKKLSPFVEPNTILATNSSTLLPSKLAKFTGCSERFLSLHFANEIYFNNTAEIMAQSKTKPECFDAVVEFAKQIRMVPLPVRKEKAGYLLNSMLVPFLFSALDLLATGVSDAESIDKAWTLGTGAPKGPFRIIDVVGLKTAYNIVLMYVKVPSFIAPYNFKKIAEVLKKYIDEGKLGVSSGEGFYKYKDKEEAK